MPTTITLPQFDAAADRAAKNLRATGKLFEMRLPAGDVGSINIGASNNGAEMKLDPQTWLSKGFSGIRFIGAGTDKTFVRCTSWDGITLLCARHAGVVQTENLHLFAGYSRATVMGAQNLAKEIVPQFKFVMLGCKGTVLPPEEIGHSGRTFWLLFGYQCDQYLADCELDANQAAEHANYAHGWAKTGCLWERVTVRSSGAEQLKARGPASETAWVGPNTWVQARNCSFGDWGQPWSNRGAGAGIVLQGVGSNVLVQDCIFRGGVPNAAFQAHERSKCIMISSEADSYDAVTGKVPAPPDPSKPQGPASGFGNGYVAIRRCMVEGHSEVEWGNTVMRCAQTTGTQQAARGFLVDKCGSWGQKTVAQASEIPVGQTIIGGCNTPEIRERCAALGMRVDNETTYPTSARKVPLSEGIRR